MPYLANQQVSNDVELYSPVEFDDAAPPPTPQVQIPLPMAAHLPSPLYAAVEAVYTRGEHSVCVHRYSLVSRAQVGALRQMSTRLKSRSQIRDPQNTPSSLRIHPTH